ncbi:MAG: uracil phosphoribosyltransferase [Bacteroidota bacterium]
MVHILGNHNSVFNQYIAEIRDEIIQKDSLRFRRNIERMGEIMSYELSKSFTYEMREVVTSLGIANVSMIKDQPVIASILRAGLPLHQGVLNYFDRAENAFISAYRRHHKNGTFDIQLEYLASPDLNDKVLILCDPMLATGSSIVLTYKALLLRGKPRHTHIVTLIASAEGVEYARKNLPENVTIWCGAVDEELTAKSYIVPGLGDAGDLAYGKKM